MDTLRDLHLLEKLWNGGEAPWRRPAPVKPTLTKPALTKPAVKRAA